jgi:hypothetical protein
MLAATSSVSSKCGNSPQWCTEQLAAHSSSAPQSTRSVCIERWEFTFGSSGGGGRGFVSDLTQAEAQWLGSAFLASGVALIVVARDGENSIAVAGVLCGSCRGHRDQSPGVTLVIQIHDSLSSIRRVWR